MKENKIEKFEVYVTPLYEGNLSAKDEMEFKSKATIAQIRSVIGQLLDGLGQLHACGKSHNDIKPNNILYCFKIGTPELEDGEDDVEIKISDFGQCDKRGGTPGWTYPSFLKDDSFNGDMYSMGLVCLYLLTEDPEIFYALRDNYVENTKTLWIKRFRKIPEIMFVTRMIDRTNQPTIEECVKEWNHIKSEINMITESRLLDIQVPQKLLTLQYKIVMIQSTLGSRSRGNVTAREK